MLWQQFFFLCGVLWLPVLAIPTILDSIVRRPIANYVEKKIFYKARNLEDEYDCCVEHLKRYDDAPHLPAVTKPKIYETSLKNCDRISHIYYFQHPDADELSQTMIYISNGLDRWSLNTITRFQRYYVVNIIYIGYSMTPYDNSVLNQTKII